MSDQVHIDNELQRISKALAVGTNEYKDLCQQAAEARDDYEIAKAKALLKADSKMKVDEKKATATLTCESEMRSAHIAEAKREAMKERLRGLQAVLNALQTRASFLKEEMKLAGRFN
jgi:hypothetical protein